MRVRFNSGYLFNILFSMLFFTRVLVLTNAYFLPFDPVGLELVYLVIVSTLIIGSFKGAFSNLLNKDQLNVFLLLFLFALLFGILGANSGFASLVSSQFKSQLVFDIILLLNVVCITKTSSIQSFVKTCYFTLAIILFFYFVINIDQVNLSNLANMLTKDDRTRANFGFAHYNTLGTACLVEFMLLFYLRGFKKLSIFYYVPIFYLIIMLLCSASRSSITGFALFIFLLFYRRVVFKKHKAFLRRLLLIIVTTVAAVFLIGVIGIQTILDESQRSLLFEHAIPLFWNSGKRLFGLGWASNTSYGMGLTLYRTYWLDNGYVYTLITTGIVGLLIMCSCLFIIWKGIDKKSTHAWTLASIFLVYLYSCLFEASLFDAGTITNYILLPLFISVICDSRRTKYGKENWNPNISCVTQ